MTFSFSLVYFSNEFLHLFSNALLTAEFSTLYLYIFPSVPRKTRRMEACLEFLAVYGTEIREASV